MTEQLQYEHKSGSDNVVQNELVINKQESGLEL